MAAVVGADVLERSGHHLEDVVHRPASLPALTALRVPLAWLVVAFHFGDLEPFRHAIGGVRRAPLGNGPFAVDCFFILSGFILFHVHSGLGHHLDKAAVRRFLWFRLARIYPVHLAVLLAFLVGIQGLALLTGVQPNAPMRFSAVAFVQHLLLIDGWGITTLLTWNYPSWSISSEWAAYLLSPGFFWLALRMRGIGLPLLILLDLLALGLLLAHGEPSLHLALPRVWLGFLLGTLVCRFRDLHRQRLSRLRSPALAGCWTAFIALLFVEQGGLLVTAFSGLILFHGLADPQARPGVGVPAMRLLVYLGETSYAVYMGHAFIEILWLTLSRKLGLIQHGNLILLALMLVMLVQGSAMLLHHYVEGPARRRLRLPWNKAAAPGLPGMAAS